MSHDIHNGTDFVHSDGHLAVLDRCTSESARPSPTLNRSTIVEHRHTADRYWHLRIHAPQIAATAQPGQFLMLTIARPHELGPVLPRPMAIYDWDLESGHVDVMYGVVGAGTTRLTSFRPGEQITTVGPLGRGFALDPTAERVLLVGRGIGTCSLTALASDAVRQGTEVIAVDSARTAHALIADAAYRRAGVSKLYQVTDADGSSDPQGLGERLQRDLDQAPPQQIFVCGSNRLINLCVQLANSGWRANLQVSLEAHMACGLGFCHGCSSGQRTADAEAPLICRDGPVFQWVHDGAGLPA